MMRSSLRATARTIAQLSVANYVAAGMSVVRGILFARVLGPADYGLWSLLSTTQSISANADLGVTQVVVRDLPAADAASYREALETVGRAWLPVVSAAAGLLVALAWPALGWPKVRLRWFTPVLFLCLAAHSGALAVEKGLLHFREYARLLTIPGLVALATGFVASTYYGIEGLIASQAAVYIIAALWSARKDGVHRSQTKTWIRVLRDSIAAGWTLLVPSVALSVFVSLDMLIAGRALTSREVGLYGVALMGSTMAASVVSNSVGTVIGQHMLRRFPARVPGVPDPEYIWAPAAGLALVLALTTSVAALATPVILGWVLPQYTEASAAAAVLLAAAYFLQSQYGFSSTFVACGTPLKPVPLFAMSTILNVVVDLWMLSLGMRMLALAAGSLLANMFFALGHMLLVSTVHKRDARQWKQMIFTLMAGGLPAAAAVDVLGGELSAVFMVSIIGLLGWAGLLGVVSEWLRSRAGAPRPGRATL